jgi:hypothetical protein
MGVDANGDPVIVGRYLSINPHKQIEMRTFLLVVLLVVTAGIAHAQTANRCAVTRPDDSQALSQLQDWVASAGQDPNRDTILRSLGVYGVSRAQITRITDDTTCMRAIAARASFRRINDDSRPIRVYLVGTEYFVEEVGSRERRVFWIFDQAWDHQHNFAL